MWWLLFLAGCKKPAPQPIDVRRICQTSCVADLRTDAERAVCTGPVLACELECRALLEDEGLPCVECLQANGVYGPVARPNGDGALVCVPGEVTRGSCTDICPILL